MAVRSRARDYIRRADVEIHGGRGDAHGGEETKGRIISRGCASEEWMMRSDIWMDLQDCSCIFESATEGGEGGTYNRFRRLRRSGSFEETSGVIVWKEERLPSRFLESNLALKVLIFD